MGSFETLHCSSVIVHESYVNDIAIVEPKDHPPVAADSNRPEVRQIPSQLVQPVTGKIKVLGRLCVVHSVKYSPNPAEEMGR